MLRWPNRSGCQGVKHNDGLTNLHGRPSTCNFFDAGSWPPRAPVSAAPPIKVRWCSGAGLGCYDCCPGQGLTAVWRRGRIMSRTIAALCPAMLKQHTSRIRHLAIGYLGELGQMMGLYPLWPQNMPNVPPLCHEGIGDQLPMASPRDGFSAENNRGR